MTQPNPFAAAVPATPAEQRPNPFAAPAAVAVPVAPQAYAGPQQQTPAPNPFAGTTSPGWPQQAPVQQAQQYAPPAAPAYAGARPGVPTLDPNALGATPAPVVGEGKGPKLNDMYGRLVLVFPQAIATVPRRPEHITQEQRAAGNVNQERLTATVVVLDSGKGTPPGGVIQWGGAPYALPATPHTNTDPLPYVRRGMWLNQSRLLSQLIPFLPSAPGQPSGMVAGRLVKTGPESNAPWYLESATEDELNLARTYLGLVGNGQYPHPLAP